MLLVERITSLTPPGLGLFCAGALPLVVLHVDDHVAPVHQHVQRVGCRGHRALAEKLLHEELVAGMVGEDVLDRRQVAVVLPVALIGVLALELSVA